MQTHTAAAIEHALEELQCARDLADSDLKIAIAAFRDTFTTTTPETRGGSLLRQAWAVHQALELRRSLDGALGHLQRPQPALQLHPARAC